MVLIIMNNNNNNNNNNNINMVYLYSATRANETAQGRFTVISWCSGPRRWRSLEMIGRRTGLCLAGVPCTLSGFGTGL